MMPDRKNRDAWWAFLEGAPESAWNSSRPGKRGKEHGGQLHGSAFALHPQPILPPDYLLAIHQPPRVTPQQPRELSPTLLFQLDHVRLSLLLDVTELIDVIDLSASLFTSSCTLHIGSICILSPWMVTPTTTVVHLPIHPRMYTCAGSSRSSPALIYSALRMR
jgi:hypothetical protein